MYICTVAAIAIRTNFNPLYQMHSMDILPFRRRSRAWTLVLLDSSQDPRRRGLKGRRGLSVTRPTVVHMWHRKRP